MNPIPRSERSRRRDAVKHRLMRGWVPLAQFRTRSDFDHGCFLISSNDLVAECFGGMRSFTTFSELVGARPGRRMSYSD